MQRQIDLFGRLSDGSRQEKKAGVSALTLAVIIVFGVSLALLLGITFYLTQVNNALYDQITQAAATVDDPEAQALQAELSSLSAETALNGEAIDCAEYARFLVEAQNGFNAEVYGVITAQKPARVTLAGIVYAEGQIILSCITEDDNPPADYAQRLDSCGAFSSVKYTGFSQDGDERIVFTIVCS